MKRNEVRPLTLAIAALLGVGSLAPVAGAVAAGLPPASDGAAATGWQIFTPASSLAPSAPANGARTHLLVLMPTIGSQAFNAAITAANTAAPTPKGLPPYAGYAYETPASLACLYKLVAAPVAGCNPNTVTAVATGGSKAIGIVDAYHYPYATTDLAAFSAQFGLPAPTTANFQVVFANGVQPATNPGGWEMEAALDIQWAHAMAPNAKIILVEAASSGWADMNAAVAKASTLVAAAGGGQVSMSYGAAEWSGETASESYYKTAKVTYFASSGDTAGTSYPCTSPNVVCVGGTTVRRDPTTKSFLGEVSWASGGGGNSPYFARPTYQNAIATVVGTTRGVPDVAAAADPSTGGWVRYTPSNTRTAGWYIVGGTSWSSPTFAGIVNSAGTFAASSAAELTTLYAGLGSANFTDIRSGYCGPSLGWGAIVGWDRCTGVGTDIGKLGK
jgi:kumamolisin